MVVVLASPTSVRNERISVLVRCVRLIRPHPRTNGDEARRMLVDMGRTDDVCTLVPQTVAMMFGLLGKRPFA